MFFSMVALLVLCNEAGGRVAMPHKSVSDPTGAAVHSYITVQAGKIWSRPEIDQYLASHEGSEMVGDNNDIN